MKKVIITIDTQGNPSIRTEGYTGGECVIASKKLTDVLGRVRSDEPTPEFYQEARSENHVQN